VVERYARISIAAAAVLICLAGCGGNGIELVPIRGEVTYNGKPLARGIVTYMPSTPGAGRTANGPIQPDGTFVMTTQTRGDGVVLGDYNIVVYSYEEGGPKTREEIEAGGGANAPKLRSTIPEKYTSPEASELTDKVDGNHSGFKKIELKD
jgi:hypothetical protein